MKALVSGCVAAAVCLLTFPSAVRADSSFAVSVNLYSCALDSVNCTQPGTLSVNGIVYGGGVMLNFPEGTTLTLTAAAGKGYVFGGWGSLAGVSGQGSTATVTVNGPLSITPIFTPASTVSVGIMTQPAGLQVSADGALLTSAATLNWAWFTTHNLAVVSPQKDPNGKWWIFAGWSDGGAASHTVSMRAGSVNSQYIARFVQGVPVDIVSHPAGMHLTIDGGTDCVQCTVIWASTEGHSLTAPLQQTDDKGLSYRFNSWADGNSGPMKIAVPDPMPDRMKIEAVFDRLGLITLDSTPGGVRMLVDGGDCYTPCVLQKPLGKALKISAPASYYTGFNSRLDFVNWAGNAGSTLTLTPSADPQIARATFKTMRQFISAVDPAEGAQVVLDPPSADGFYDANSKVNVALVAQPGFRLDHWEGDLGGSDTAGWLTMGLPRQVIARMHPIPYVGPRAVRNAATEMHGDTVTACSIVTIAGLHLSTATESAPSGLPRQFLAGTGVRMGDSFLPLYAVSPTEISAQLPCNLLEGPNSLIVHAGYEPEVLSNFTVVRNSPGLFTRPVAGQSYAIATHNDGSAVTPDNPAVDGETVSVFGTGFGPLMTAAVAGIAIQPSPEFQLADPLEALLGTTPLSSSYAGAGGSQPGMDAVQVTVNAGGSSTFKVRINGKESNAVLLPVGN